MTAWDLVLWASAACAAAALVAGALGRVRPDPRHAALERRLLLTAAGLAALAFLRLLWAFVAAEVSLQYVFLYTHADLPLHWRIAGTWAGREGSLLLWAMDLAVVGALVAWRHARRAAADEAESTGRAWTRLFLSAAVLAFLAAAAAQGTFARTPDFYLQGRPDGNGLNPTLKSAFILIHPPLMFAAYALATVPAAAVLGHLASGSDRWGKVGLAWSRVDWLLYTFAMGLGGLWAYYTLGFGGYWAWDPVEVANLLPWLALTVFLHAQLHHARYGHYRIIGPFLGLLPFLLTLFSTISTRSGLWVSVHAFTDPTNTFEPDAPMRFLDILAVEPGLLVYVRLFLGTLGLGLALWCLRLSREAKALPRAAPAIAAVLAAVGALGAIAPRTALGLLFEAAYQATGGRPGLGLLGLLFLACVAAALPALVAKDDGPRRPLRVDLRTLAAASVAILGLSLLVLFLAHMAAVNGWDTAFYESRLPWLATPALLGLVVLQSHSIIGRRRSLLLAAALLAAAVVAHLVAGGGAYLLVLSAALVAVSLDRVRRAALAPGMDKRRRLGPTLLFAAALLDLWFWLSPPSSIGGPLDLHLVWPVQAVMGTVAAYALWGSLRMLAGAPPRAPGHVYLVAGLLAGFWVAAPLALVAYLLDQRHADARTPKRIGRSDWSRLRLAGLYGAHMAVAVALLAYAPSTYWKETTTVDVGFNEPFAAGPFDVSLVGASPQTDASDPFADGASASFLVDGHGALDPGQDIDASGAGQVQARLHWEPQVGAYFPHPSTLRTWRGDLYLNIDAVHVAESPCSGERTIQVYQGANPPQMCSADTIDRVTVQATWLPGVGLMWTALALFVLAMALTLAADREPTPRDAPDLP
jgi:hypothetical protein